MVPGGGPFADAVRAAQPAMGFDDDAAHDMALMAMAQYGRALTALTDGFVYTDTIDAVRGVLARGDIPVWSPWPMLRAHPDIPRSWDVTSDSLAVWLAGELDARRVVLIKHRTTPGEGLVDAAFPHFTARFGGTVRIAGPDDLAVADTLFGGSRRPGLTMVRQRTPRWAWAITGSGHFFTETLDMVRALGDVDLFVSRAAAEVVRMYKTGLNLPKGCQVFHDNTASAAPVAMFYHGVYHTVVVAPATSNTVAKCVVGISDTLVTNVFAQAGKCRVPADRLRLRQCARDGDRGTRRHGESLSAPDRS